MHLNPNSGVPIYRQVVQQLRQRIASGRLALDDQLPSARDLSRELKINPLTVIKAYQILEREGYVEMRRGLGTFATGAPRAGSAVDKRKWILPAVQQVVAEAKHLKLSASELRKLIDEQFREASDDEPSNH